MVAAVVMLTAFGVAVLVVIFVVRMETYFQLGALSTPSIHVLIPAFSVFFCLGCIFGFRRGKKRRNWFS